MSLAEKQALALRDLAVNVAKAKGVISHLIFTAIGTRAFGVSVATASRAVQAWTLITAIAAALRYS